MLRRPFWLRPMLELINDHFHWHLYCTRIFIAANLASAACCSYPTYLRRDLSPPNYQRTSSAFRSSFLGNVFARNQDQKAKTELFSSILQRAAQFHICFAALNIIPFIVLFFTFAYCQRCLYKSPAIKI